MWMAGGGVKGGPIVGATDEIGLHAVADRAHVNDLHATILHLLGLDHTRLTFLHNGRDERLTDVAGRVLAGSWLIRGVNAATPSRTDDVAGGRETAAAPGHFGSAKVSAGTLSRTLNSVISCSTKSSPSRLTETLVAFLMPSKSL